MPDILPTMEENIRRGLLAQGVNPRKPLSTNKWYIRHTPTSHSLFNVL